MSTEWEVVIGLEIHTQLAAQSKIFSGASTAYGGEPNTQACLVDLGYPGTLPVLNQQAVEMAIRFGLAIDAEIASRSIFARKNYFYPDLPKGYQISQLDLPIVIGGKMSILDDDKNEKVIGITRAHLEEDAGKSIHEGLDGSSGIDLNRAGTPLLEIVSEPEMSSAKEVFEAMWEGEGSAGEIIERKGLVQITDDSEIENIVNKVIENNPSQVKEYLDGKSQLLGYFVGQIMKETGGKANPQKVNEILKMKLK